MIEDILKENKPEDLKALFAFDSKDKDDLVLMKFNLWARHLFPKYFTSKDAPHHKKADRYRLDIYRGRIKTFTDAEYRGAAKTARTKLFIAFCVANDMDRSRRYIKILSEDGDNSSQITTDIYNMFISPQTQRIYPEIFKKTRFKREERMSSFTTSTGIKITADIVGTGQRGQLQEDARPDLIWFEDFENRKSLLSAVTTNKIWLNMEEARTGLAKDGVCIYTCNYISEAGNVHKLVTRSDDDQNILMIVPIIKDGVVAWDRYTLEDVEYMKKTDEDFEGERLCQPSASKDIYFDRITLNNMPTREPIRNIANFKMFREYNALHRYGLGADPAGGMGLDSSASVIIDFDTIPAQVVGTYHSNTILPEAFADEIVSQADRFGRCVLAPENNKYDQVILKAKQLKANLFMTPHKAIKAGYSVPNTLGWNTNKLTKSKMFSDLREAVDSGWLLLNDKDLINEARGYTRNDMIDSVPDVRLTTRHFDLLTACAIAWQMKDFSRAKKKKQKYRGLNDMEEDENPAI